MSFSIASFIKNRTRGLDMSPDEESSFEPYLAQVALENDTHLAPELLTETNTEAFFRLSKKLQAHAFDCLYGMAVNIKYNPTRGKRVDALRAKITECMKCNNLDYNTAKQITLLAEGRSSRKAFLK